MENASKALLIAGGVLIALVIISMFILMFSRISNIQEEQEKKTQMEQLTAFNEEYEAYNKKVMYGTDVITLINKTAENNKKYSENADYKIVVTLDGKPITTSKDLIGTDMEKTIFKCSGTKYNNLGRICEINIVTKR